jgi:putative membrane protein
MIMSIKIRTGHCLAFLLLATPAWAGAFNAEVDFVTRASNADLVAAAESRLALGRAIDPKVKAFARRLAQDHAKAQAALQVAAIGSGANVLTTLARDDQKLLAALQDKSGVDFDKAYVADQLAVHSNALTLYADYMLLGDNEKLKDLAIKMIPIAEAQLKVAQALDGD